jgi:lysophospholipase L1-like esterase
MIDVNKLYRFDDENEKPLETLVTDGGFCGILSNVGFIGDSLSSGEFQSRDTEGKPGYHDLYEYSWGQFLARDAGLTAYNFSKGGMTAKVFIDSFGREKGFYDEDKKCRAYVIAMGVNDITRAVNGVLPFGKFEDFNMQEPEKSAETSIAYYGRIISEIKRIQPKARVFLMTIPRNPSEPPERTEYANKLTEAIYKFADAFEFTYVIDLQKYGPAYDDDFRRHFFLDGHMNAAGYQFHGRLAASYIDYIIRHNMDDFMQIGFVGTPYKNVNYKW